MSRYLLWILGVLFSVLLLGCGGVASSTSNNNSIEGSSFTVQDGTINQPYNPQISNYAIKFESSINVCGINNVGVITSCFTIESQNLSFGYRKSFYFNSEPITLKRVESDFPNITCQNKNTLDDGSVYLMTPYSFITVNGQDVFAPVNYIVAVNNQCYPVWYQRLVGSNGFDLKLIESNLIYKNRNVLNTANDKSIIIYPTGRYEQFISSSKGISNDPHDIIFNNLESYINLYYTLESNQVIDNNGTIGNMEYTFFTTNSGETIFRAIDYYNVSDILDPSEVDYPCGDQLCTNLDHGNSVAYTNDGNIVYNSRNTSSILKINPQGGNVIWQFGGVRNQFRVLNDPLYPFMYEHFVRQLPNGNYIVFDNGTTERGYSRVVEYSIDESNMTATMVWQFIDPRHIFAPYMGNGERLQNGNTVVNYGTLSDKSLPQVEEVDSYGNVMNQIFFPNLTYSYRAYKVDLPNKYRDLVMPTEVMNLPANNIYQIQK
jgi:hypothetical protein